jgi:hypothetical protein
MSSNSLARLAGEGRATTEVARWHHRKAQETGVLAERTKIEVTSGGFR